MSGFIGKVQDADLLLTKDIFDELAKFDDLCKSILYNSSLIDPYKREINDNYNSEQEKQQFQEVIKLHTTKCAEALIAITKLIYKEDNLYSLYKKYIGL